MLTQQFISVMSSANSVGALDLNLTTYDLQANISLTLSVSGITGTETENQLAYKCFTQLNTRLAQLGYQYPNIPPININTVVQPYLAFPDQVMYPFFSVNYCDNIVNIAGQSNFSVSVTNNATGAKVVSSNNPILITLAEARYKARWLGLSFLNADGSAYTDNQLTDLLQMSSEYLTSFLNNYIVPVTYMYYEITQGTRSVFVQKGPIIDFFPPVARRPSFLFSLAMGFIFGTYKGNFAIDKSRNEIYYRYAQDFVLNYEPFDDGNEIMIPYIAGHKQIPNIIKDYTLNFINLLQLQEYKSMQGQSFRWEVFDRFKIYQQVGTVLGKYYCE